MKKKKKKKRGDCSSRSKKKEKETVRKPRKREFRLKKESDLKRSMEVEMKAEETQYALCDVCTYMCA